jgi:hypothetical protein
MSFFEKCTCLRRPHENCIVFLGRCRSAVGLYQLRRSKSSRENNRGCPSQYQNNRGRTSQYNDDHHRRLPGWNPTSLLVNSLVGASGRK